jgi:malate synthase
LNTAPATFSIERDLPLGFAAFYRALHNEFMAPRTQLLAERSRRLKRAHNGDLPKYPSASAATNTDWSIDLPNWCRDQRNQMTGPADDAEICVKMLNSGAPGVMLDLEDALCNEWSHTMLGVSNSLAALYGELTYTNAHGRTIGIDPSPTVTFIRVRNLHLHQAGIFPEEPTSAALFDLALLTYQLDFSRLAHPLSIYIAKSESPEEALWWRDVFQRLADYKKIPRDSIKCMALVESHPLAFQIEEFAYNLREHILGLNLGRWDYMASLIHYLLADPDWLFPDRNSIPHDIAFFQNLRILLPSICHKHGMLAIGGITALFPDRADPAQNERALRILAKDKRNEAQCRMDGAWTGHPDQNAIAVAAFPFPNQIGTFTPGFNPHPNLRPSLRNRGTISESGTRAAVRTVIRYRNGYLNGKGASLLDGYMEDLATDRIYRLMIAQRLRFGIHRPDVLTRFFDEELQRLLVDRPKNEAGNEATLSEARRICEAMILNEEFDPS